MNRSESSQLWALIETELSHARNCLGEGVAGIASIKHFHDYLAHNELEMACDSLSDFGEEHLVSAEFWLALHRAAMKMNLIEKADIYKRHAELTINKTRG